MDKLKPEFPASVQPAASAQEQAIAAASAIPLIGGAGTSSVSLAGGGYAAIWLKSVLFERFGGILYDLMTQSFTASGAVIGNPMLIGQTIPGRYWISRPTALPRLAALTGGGYVVVWALPSHTDSGVYAQRFNADGTAAGAAHQVTPDGSGYLSVTGLATGGYMITWGGAGGQGYARAYTPKDVPLGPVQATGPSYIRFENHYPTYLSPLAGGGAVLVWLRSQAGVSSGYVHVVQLAPDGAPLGPPRIVDGSAAPNPAHGDAPAAAGLADGGYVVAWLEAGEAHARRFAADGTPVAAEMRVNLATTDVEQPIGAAAAADGGFVVSWSGVGADGVRRNYTRAFGADGLTGAP